MIIFQEFDHFFGGYRNQTDCVASCELRHGGLPTSLTEIEYIIGVITSIQFDYCVHTAVSF